MLASGCANATARSVSAEAISWVLSSDLHVGSSDAIHAATIVPTVSGPLSVSSAAAKLGLAIVAAGTKSIATVVAGTVEEKKEEEEF
jgi:hypothetical protein